MLEREPQKLGSKGSRTARRRDRRNRTKPQRLQPRSVCAWCTRSGRTKREFEQLALQIKLRNDVLEKSQANLKNVVPTDTSSTDTSSTEAVFRLAAVDLFVEKAQDVLTHRARNMVRAGIATSVGAVAALITLSVFIARHAGDVPYDHTLNINVLVLRVVSAISLGAIVLVGVKYFVALARSFLHESVTLLGRRHALRFGRMYVYLNAGNKEMKLEDLREAFQWNIGGDSSFLDIKPEEIGKTPWSALAQSLGPALEKAVEKGIEKGFRNAQPNKKEDEDSDNSKDANSGS